MGKDNKKPTDKQKIDVEKIDLERFKEKTSDKPGTLTFPHSVGGVVIKPEDKGKIKGRAVKAMQQQTESQMDQLKDQMRTLVQQAHDIKDRVEVSERIYTAEMNFEPIIGHTYYFYQKKSGKDVISMVGPNEWGRVKPFSEYIAEVTLLADHTWDVIRFNEDDAGDEE